MKIHKTELAIAHLIEGNTSIAYTVGMEPCELTDIPQAALAGCDHMEEDDQLYPTKSIFVSTTWNLNDDIFVPAETWAARKSPLHKPTNQKHECLDIVGHVTSCWALDEDGNEIPDSVSAEGLPNAFHIANGAVIYKKWRNAEKQIAINKLIEDVQAGRKFVSMECYFTDFDFALLNADGSFEVVPRNESTAFLSRHLRAYGGAGEYEGTKVGRVLKNITFSGKAYVDNPANPSSIVTPSETFSIKNEKNSCSSKKTGVYINRNTNTESKMSDELVTKLEKQVEQLTAANTELSDKLAQNDKKQLEVQLDEAKASIETLESKLKGAEDAKACMCNELGTMKQERDGLLDQIAELKAQLAEIQVEAQTKARLAKLVESGFSQQDAEAKLESLKSLDDATFEQVVGMIQRPKTVVAPQEKEDAPVEDTVATVKDKEVPVEPVPTGEDNSAEASIKAISDHYLNLFSKGKK